MKLFYLLAFMLSLVLLPIADPFHPAYAAGLSVAMASVALACIIALLDLSGGEHGSRAIRS